MNTFWICSVLRPAAGFVSRLLYRVFAVFMRKQSHATRNRLWNGEISALERHDMIEHIFITAVHFSSVKAMRTNSVLPRDESVR